MRFYWKQASAVGGTEAKILRNVSYPKVFDIFEFCTDELKQSLLQGRELEAANREQEDSARLAGMEEEKKQEEAKGGAAQAEGGDVEM